MSPTLRNVDNKSLDMYNIAGSIFQEMRLDNMKLFKKATAAMLAVLMLLCFASCGENNGTEITDVPTETTTSYIRDMRGGESYMACGVLWSLLWW